MLQTHGNIKECIHFAEETGCYKELIVHYINKQQYTEALKKLERIEDKKVRNDQMRIYASILLKNTPAETLRSLSGDKFRDIEIESLIPALHGIPKQAIVAATDFLIDYCIKRRHSRAKSVHNMAFYLYTEHENGEQLITYLQLQE